MTEPYGEDEVENLLYNLGLCRYEARAYLTLLNDGPQNYKGLIKLSGIPYGRIYSTLRSLSEKGWVIIRDQRPKIFYAVDPETPLRNYLTRMKEQVESLEKTILRVSPKLKILYNQSFQISEGTPRASTPGPAPSGCG